MKRKPKLRSLTHKINRGRYPTRDSLEYTRGNNKERYNKRTEKIPIVKNFQYEIKQEWNPPYPHEHDDKKTRYFVPKHIQSFCEYLKDLFCIDDKIFLQIRYYQNNHNGLAWYHKVSIKDGYLKIQVGAKEGLRATTLIHEFLHAAGFDHEYEMNGTHDFRSTCTLDTYSPLICKDIFGIKEVFLT
jgi:hypothetical protein